MLQSFFKYFNEYIISQQLYQIIKTQNAFSSIKQRSNNLIYNKMDDDFDFSDAQNDAPKKTIKKSQPKQTTKRKNNNDDFQFEQVENIKTKSKQNKKNNFQYSDMSSYLDEIENKSPSKKPLNTSKQNDNNSLPPINIPKPADNKDKKPIKSKMDLSLEELNTDKKVLLEKQKNINKYQSDDYDHAINSNKPKQTSELKKSQQKLSLITNKINHQNKSSGLTVSPKNSFSNKINDFSPKNVSVQKSLVKKQEKSQIYQEEIYDQEYEEQIEEENVKSPIKQTKKVNENQKSNINEKKQQNKDQSQERKGQQKKSPNKPSSSQNRKQTKPQNKKPLYQQPKKPPTKAQSKQIKQPLKTQIKQKSQTGDQKISKFKEMVQKSFPQDQTQQKIQKMKPDAINRLNDKMRQMIKGFSAQLTALIDKNLMLLKRPQNQIKQEIQGEPQDPVQAQIKVLLQTKKNNIKIIQNTDKELEISTKMSQKISLSSQNKYQILQEIQTYKKYIGITTRQIGNLKNQIEKQGKKVIKLQQNADSNQNNPKLKNGSQIRQKLTNTRLQFDKNKKKLLQLQQKLANLQQKMTDATDKKAQILQKAQKQGISICSKEQKKKYQQLNKKRLQLKSFQTKFKAATKSKQVLIQHQISDFQALIYEYQQKFQTFNQQAQSTRKKMFSEITKAKQNPKISVNTKQILTQLQLFMAEGSQATQERISSLNFISQKIYNKQYHKNAKSLTQQKQDKKDKKTVYKNYLQSLQKIQQQNKIKFQNQRKNSQKNPFKRSFTPGPNQFDQMKNTDKEKQKIKMQTQKQKQRLWKDSKTQNLIRNPLKNRYNQNEQKQQNLMKNKEIIKLIDKNKQKMFAEQLPSEKTSIIQQATSLPASNGPNKKPFSFRSSVKDKQIKQNTQQMNSIQKDMQKIRQNLDSIKNQTNIIEEQIGVKLKDKQLHSPSKQNIQIKPTLNASPFKNMRLKKDKTNDQNNNTQSQPAFKLQIQKPFQIRREAELQMKQSQEEINSFKPKRFNLRKKQDGQSGYQPSIQQSTSQMHIQKPPVQTQPKYQISNRINIQKKEGSKQNKQQQFNPFKNFLNNAQKQDKSIKINDLDSNTKGLQSSNQLSLKQNSQPLINLKPKLNLFRKQQPQQKQQQRKLILLNDASKNIQPPIKNIEPVYNPYANMIKNNNEQQNNIAIKRQGRIKKTNQNQNSIKPVSKNIYDNVDDMTVGNNILSLGEENQNRNRNSQNQAYQQPKIVNNNQPNLNELLGIQKKKQNFDPDLLLDLPKDPPKNRVSINRKQQKKADFFADMEI